MDVNRVVLDRQGNVGHQVSSLLKPRALVRAGTEVRRVHVPSLRTGRDKALQRAASLDERQTRALSVSDLLVWSSRLQMNSDTLFPRIDTEKYQSNAPVTMYLADLTDTDEDIATYFQADFERSGPLKGGYIRMTPITSRHGSIQHSIDADETRDSLTALKPLAAQSRMRKLSMPVSIRRSSVALDRESCFNITPSIWFGCHVTYMVIDKSLMVQMERRGSLLSEIGRKPLRLVVKLRLMPGHIQKQKVKIASENDSPLERPRAFFRGFSIADLSSMCIGVQVFRRMGMFRKSRLVHEWSIRLSDFNFKDQQTAWKQIQWRA